MKLVFDCGATRTRLALSEDGKTLGEPVILETDRSAKGFAALLGAIDELRGDHRLEAVAGGLPGQVSPTTGEFGYGTNLPEWTGLPVVERLEALVKCPVHILNDATLGGLGEAHAAPELREGVMAYFTVSTGVNAVRIVHGRIDTSIRSFEIGKQLVADSSGHLVPLESLTSGAAFMARRGESPRGVRDKRVWRAEERYLARGLYNTILHWTPDVIVFGGSMMRDIELEMVARELEELPKASDLMPRLTRARLGDTAGLHGALMWLHQQHS
jgi:predicted NBD/HSP70 family sugar kinase